MAISAAQGARSRWYATTLTMNELTVRLKRGKDRPVRLGHPWIFSGAIADPEPAVAPGTVVRVVSADAEFLGRGYINPRCAIAVRLLTLQDEPIDARFIHSRLEAAVHLRRCVLPAETDAYRLINGEGDFLPGFIADVYGSTIVVQCLTAGAESLKPLLVSAIEHQLRPACIYQRSTGSVRREEGLEPAVGVLAGTAPNEPIAVTENGFRFSVDVSAGQKTGFFLDQRDNRSLAAVLAADCTVLNAFAYSGAFSVYAGRGGARHVISVESSASALTLARRNWVSNELPGERAEFVEADVFAYLRQTEQQFDLLILDPPPLVRRRHEVERGARAYKDLHLWAFRRAAPGALMLTFSCSQHVTRELFAKIVHGAARDAGCAVRVLRQLGAGADHPINLAHPEAEYLKGLLLHIT